MTFKITVQPSGHQFQANENELILDAALAQGLNFPYGCRSGSCGNCIGQVLEGEIAYPGGTPLGLTDEQLSENKALFCQAVAKTDLEIEVAEIKAADGITAKKLPARVTTLERLADDVMLMELQLPASQRLQFLAGQYIDILLQNGGKRAFSLANAPHNDERLQLHIRKVEGGYFTSHVFDEMQEKSLLRIEGPLGSFFLRDESERPVILMGGGTGFAPLKAMVEHLIASESQRQVHLYWGVKSEPDLYLGDLAQSWADQHPNITFTPVLSDEPKGEWRGRRGWVHEAVVEDFPDLSAFELYMSGPPPMIVAGKAAFLARGLPEEHCYSDSFDFSHGG